MIPNPEIVRFEEIMYEIKELADEAAGLLPRDANFTNSALSYWAPTINGCVDGRATMTTMAETLDALKEYYENETQN